MRNMNAKLIAILGVAVAVVVLVVLGTIASQNSNKIQNMSKREVYDEIVDVANNINTKLTGDDFLEANYTFSKNVHGDIFVSIYVMNANVDTNNYADLYSKLVSLTQEYENAFKDRGMNLVSYVLIKNNEGGTKEYSISFNELLEDGVKVYTKE